MEQNVGYFRPLKVRLVSFPFAEVLVASFCDNELIAIFFEYIEDCHEIAVGIFGGINGAKLLRNHFAAEFRVCRAAALIDAEELSLANDFSAIDKKSPN